MSRKRVDVGTWLDIIDNPEAIRVIYGADLPRLDGVDFHDVTLERGRISLRYDLMAYPADPPRKWRTNHFNTVQLKLLIFDLHAVSIDRWGFSGVADLSLSKDDDLVVVKVTGSEIRLSAKADVAHVSSVSAHIDARRNG